MKKLFGTDGIRGVANKEPMIAEVVFHIGRAGAYLFKDEIDPKILIGRDTRISGDMLEAALIAGICSMGVDVLRVGITPTPAVAYLARVYNANCGIVISIKVVSPSTIFSPSFNAGGTFTDRVLVIPLTLIGIVSKNSKLFILE